MEKIAEKAREYLNAGMNKKGLADALKVAESRVKNIDEVIAGLADEKADATADVDALRIASKLLAVTPRKISTKNEWKDDGSTDTSESWVISNEVYLARVTMTKFWESEMAHRNGIAKYQVSYAVEAVPVNGLYAPEEASEYLDVLSRCVLTDEEATNIGLPSGMFKVFDDKEDASWWTEKLKKDISASRLFLKQRPSIIEAFEPAFTCCGIKIPGWMYDSDTKEV